MRKVLIVTAITGVTAGTLYGTFYAGRITTEPVKVFADKEIDVSDISFKNKIDDLKGKVVDDLKSCESSFSKESDGLVIYDPKKGGKNDDRAMSYGLLQFKKATVIYYYKTIYNKVITGKEAILIALDDNMSSSLAKDIMFTTKSRASGDWTNCERKLNLDMKIDMIKKLIQN